MKQTVTQSKALDIARGASIFATGGGMPYEVQISLIDKVFRSIPSVELVDIDGLREEDCVCTIYGAGSADRTDVDLSEAIQKGLIQMERLIGKKFVAVFAGETNIEALIFQSAAAVGLPILDADCTGGRAVPELQFDNFSIFGKKILPLVVATLDGKVITLKQTKDERSIEKFVRNIVISTKNSVAVLDHPVSVRQARQYLTFGVFERSRRVGVFLKKHCGEKDNVKNLAQRLKGKVLFEGKISDVKLTDKDGFLHGYLEIISASQGVARIYVKNESLVLWVNSKVVLTPPDLITIIDRAEFIGIHNSQISQHTEVAVLGIPAVSLWRTAEGLTLFNPRKFGFDMEIHLL